MAKMKIVVLLQCCFLILKIPRALCEKRKTIKIEKRGFPHGWDIGVRKYFDPGDQKEVTICMRFRTFSYNEGMGWPFHMTNHCTDPDDMWQEACYDKFGWNFAIGWKTGLEDDNRQAGQTFLWFSHDNQTAREVDFQGAEITRWLDPSIGKGFAALGVLEISFYVRMSMGSWSLDMSGHCS